MDARERWQALQAHLTAARQALDRGDEAAALQELNAALAIDPEFAAARALRDRIGVPELRPTHLSGPGVSDAVQPPPLFSDAPPDIAATPRPLVSAEGFARFEQRAKRRRIDRRADAARSAIAERRLRDAAVAIDEIRELDPDAPEIAPLAFALAAASQTRGRRRRWHVGPQLAAAAAFAAIVLVSWVQQPPPRGLLSYPMSIVAALVSTAQPAPLIATMSAIEEPPVGTSGDVASEGRTVAPAAETLAMSPRLPLNASLTDVAPSVAPAPPPTPAPASATNVSTAPPPVVPAAVSLAALETTPPPAAVLPASSASEAPTTIVESKLPDDTLVRRTLQQYKNAYDALDARSAQAVWPVVNERALAHAFDGLESQNVTFDACDVQVTGDLARALCRGTTRYVAKVGSREPRTEPRIWNFTLRRTGPDWKIESARADR